jgi:hypothetical protein
VIVVISDFTYWITIPEVSTSGDVMSNRASALVGNLLSLIVWAVVVWGELVGNVHAFRQHGVRDGFAALFVPPWSWYRGMEFFWHKPRAENGPAQEVEYPALNTEEESAVSRVFSKAMQEPLTEDDLAAYQQVLSHYAKRTGKPLTRRDLEQLSEAVTLSSEYHREMARCLLLSIDQKKPFISTDLERLRKRVEETGLVRKAKLDADFRNIDSAANGTALTDEFGHQHYPITRKEVLLKLKEDDIVDDNMKRITALVEKETTN